METADKKKSSFVNVIAWLMMGLGSFSLLIAGFQLFFVLFVLPDDAFSELRGLSFEQVPSFFSLMLANLHILIGFVILAYVLQIIAGFGLWKRYRWAWLVSIAIFSIILLGTITAGIGQQIFYVFMFDQMQTHAAADPIFTNIQLYMRIVAGVMMLTMSVLWGWILYRLSRPEIRAEFV